jgi:acyl-CoA dehydrogenase
VSVPDQLRDVFSARLGRESQEVRAERLRIRAFLADSLADGRFEPKSDSWLSGYSPAFSRLLGEQGWIGMTWPTELGGRGVAPDLRYAVVEELLAAGAPVAAHWFADRQVGPSLLRHGTADQQRRLLPGIAAGTTYFCIGMSEPESGSDLGSVRTRARRVSGGWLVSGSKIWTSHADRAHYMLSLVRTGAAEDAAAVALTQVIIDMGDPGVVVRPIKTLDGQAHFCEVFLDDVMVGDDMLLGEPGCGWHQVLSELTFERSGPERFLSTFPLIREFVAALPELDEGRADDLGRLISRLGTLRAMSERVNARLGTDAPPGLAAALVKDAGTRFEQDTVQIVRRWLGTDNPALGATLDYVLAHAPNFTLRGGTNEILRNIIGKEVLAP